jgi:hypothetical protein
VFNSLVTASGFEALDLMEKSDSGIRTVERGAGGVAGDTSMGFLGAQDTVDGELI